nr:helix-turn-helix domain-containing protein [Metabacillus dongyingensis]
MVNYNTGINIFMNIAGGKWKCLILFFLSQKSVRTKEFYELIPGITQKVLTDQLKQLEREDLYEEKYLKRYHQK